MAVPEAVLARLRDLDGPLARVQSAIYSIYESPEVTREDLDRRIGLLEEAVDDWLHRTFLIEIAPDDSLVDLAPPIDDLIDRLDDYLARVAEADVRDDIAEALGALQKSNALRADGTAADALGRLCGLSLLHVAIACDVGSLSDLDRLEPGERLGDALGLPSTPPTTIHDTAYRARLMEALGSDLALLKASGHVRLNSPQYPESQAMDKILDRATGVTKAILAGAAPSGALFSHIKSALTVAATAGPADLRQAVGSAVGRITRIVGKLLKRVGMVIGWVSKSYSSTISRFISTWVDQKKDQLVDRVIRAVLDRVLGESELEYRIDAAYQGGGQRLNRRQRNAALNDLLKKNKRWVGPARPAAKGLHFLWPVQVGPVPTAPIAACALLAWTLIITGDQLDARGPFPKFWEGIGTIATR